MNTFKGRFLGLVLLQLIILASLIGMKQWTIRTGDHILLKATPVDPRELFRGDYVALGYDISRIPRRLWDGEGFRKGDAVSVTLSRTGRFWEVESVRKSPPEQGTLFLKGRVVKVTTEPQSNWDVLSTPTADLAKGKSDTTKQKLKEMEVVYGIESYFLPTRRAREMEENPDAVFVAEVVVDKSGRAVLHNLLLEKRKPPQRLDSIGK